MAEDEPLYYSLFEDHYPDPTVIIHFLDSISLDEQLAEAEIARWVEEHPEQEATAADLQKMHFIMREGNMTADEMWLELELHAEKVQYEREIIESVNGLWELPDDIRIPFILAVVEDPDSWQAQLRRKHQKRWIRNLIELPDEYFLFETEVDDHHSADGPENEAPPPRVVLRTAQPPHGVLPQQAADPLPLRMCHQRCGRLQVAAGGNHTGVARTSMLAYRPVGRGQDKTGGGPTWRPTRAARHVSTRSCGTCSAT